MVEGKPVGGQRGCGLGAGVDGEELDGESGCVGPGGGSEKWNGHD